MSLRVERAGCVKLLDQPLITVGRSSTNDFLVTGEHVSRHHLEISREQGDYVLKDVSTLGLFDLRGAKLPPTMRLGSQPVQIRLGSEHGSVLTLRRGPPRRVDGAVGRTSSTRRSQPPKSLGEWTDVVRASLKPYRRTALFALGGACFAYLANFYIAAKVYDGYHIPPGGAATGGPSENSARLLWFLASALLMSMVGSMVRLRPAGFVSRVLALPGRWWRVMRSSPVLCLATLMLSAAVALLLAGVLIPSLSLVIGLGMLAVLPTPLGSLLISLSGGLLGRTLGATRQAVSVTTDGLGVAVLVGGALALMLRWRADSTGERWVLVGVLAAAGLVLMVRERRQISQVTVMMFGFAGVVVVRMLTEGPRVLADDGGWAECGARLGDFLRCEGVPELAKGMGDGAAAGAAGGAVGGVVSSPSGPDSDPAGGDDDGRFEQYDEDGYLERVVYDTDGDKIPEAVEHYDRDGNVIRTDFFDGEGKSDGYEVPTYDTDNRQNGTVRRDKDGNITVTRELDDNGGYTDTQYDPQTGKPASSHQEHGDGRHTIRENPDGDGNFTKATEYDRDHRKVETTEMMDDGGIQHTEYDPETGDPTTLIQEHPDGTKTVLSDPDPDGVATKKSILDADDNVTRKSAKNDDGSSTHTDYDPSTGKAWRVTIEEADGSTTVLSDPDENGVARHKATYDSNENLTRESVKNPDGSSTHIDYDSETGDVVATTTTLDDLSGASDLDAPPRSTAPEETGEADLSGADELDAPPPSTEDAGTSDARDGTVYDQFDVDGDGVLDGGYDEDGNLRAEGLDTDGDGRIDKIIYYDDEGNPAGYEYDRNKDGHLDTFVGKDGEETFIGQEHERADGATALRDGEGNVYGWEKDTDGDGRADYWEFHDEGGVYAESDRNRDGRPDTRYEYDKDGRLIGSSRDTDYDGKYDTDWSYDRDGNVTSRNEDTDDDGIPNKSYDGDGNLRASGADTDGDGHDDALVYYDDEGNPYAYEYDSDRDGRVDAYADRPPEAGWYDDPKNPSQLRWWDGSRWTTHTRSDEGT